MVLFKNNFAKFLAVSFTAVVLASCGGGGGSSSGNSGSGSSGFAGKAIKGPIEGGTVSCYDKNDRKVEDAKTTSDGNYKLNKECDKDGKLVVNGGIDKSTGELVEELVASGRSKYITPLTTMDYVSKKYGLPLSDEGSRELLEKAEKQDPSLKSSTESQKLSKMAVTLHSMVRNLQEQSEEDLSYEESMLILTERMQTKSVKTLADDNQKKAAKDLVTEVFDDLEKSGLVKIPDENKNKIKEIIDENAGELQKKDVESNGLKRNVPSSFSENLPSRYVRVTDENLKNSNYELKFEYNSRYSNIKSAELENTDLGYECKIFTKDSNKSFTFRDNWDRTTSSVPCDINAPFSVASADRGKYLVIRYFDKNDLRKKSYSPPHKIGSMASLGNRNELKFNDKVYLPINGKYATETVGTIGKVLETGSNKMGYLPVGFYYKPEQVPTARFRNVSFGVELQIGGTRLVMMADKLFIKENSLEATTAKNTFLHNVGNNSSGISVNYSKYYHNANLINTRSVFSDLSSATKRTEYHTEKAFLRFKKPTEINDVLKMGNQTALGVNDNLVGVDLANLCNRPISPARNASNEFKGTVCDYIRSTINLEQAKSVVITPFIKSVRRSAKQKSLFKTDQTKKITVMGIGDYETFPSITVEGATDSKAVLIPGKTGLRGIDSDGDGVSDYDEIELGRNPFSDRDKDYDTDGDGLKDVDELKLGLNAKDATDKVEVKISRSEVSISEGGEKQSFTATITGPNNIGKYINLRLEGGAENVMSLNLTPLSDIVVAGSIKVDVTPSANFGTTSSPHIVITPKIKNGINEIKLAEKTISLLLKTNASLTPKSVALSYKVATGTANYVTTSNFLGDVEITAKPTLASGVASSSVTAQYRWEHSNNGNNWNIISGANNSKYVVKEDNIGKFIRVSVVYKRKSVKDANWGLSLSKIAKNASDSMVQVHPQRPTIKPVLTSNEGKFYIGSVITMTEVAKSGHTISYKWREQASGTSGWTDITGANSKTYTIPVGVTKNTKYQGCYAYQKGGVVSEYLCSTTNATVGISPRIGSIEFRAGGDSKADIVKNYTVKTDGSELLYYRNNGSRSDSYMYVRVVLPKVISDTVSLAGAEVVIGNAEGTVSVPAFGSGSGNNIFTTKGSSVALFRLNDKLLSLIPGKTYEVKSVEIPGHSYDLPASKPNLVINFAGWTSGDSVGATIYSNTKPYRKGVGDFLEAKILPVYLDSSFIKESHQWQSKDADSDGDCSSVAKDDTGWNNISNEISFGYTVKSADEGKCIRATIGFSLNGATPAYHKSQNVESAAVAIVSVKPSVEAKLESNEKSKNKFYRLSVIKMNTTAKSGYSVAYKWKHNDNVKSEFKYISAVSATYQVPSSFTNGKKILGCYAYKKNGTNILSDYKCMQESSAKTVEVKPVTGKQDKSKIGNWKSNKDIIMELDSAGLVKRLYVAVKNSVIPSVAKGTVPRLEIKAMSADSSTKVFALGKRDSCSFDKGKLSLPKDYSCFGSVNSNVYLIAGEEIKVRWAEYITNVKVSAVTSYSDGINLDSLVIKISKVESVLIEGGERVGSTLTAETTGVLDGATIEYQWQWTDDTALKASWKDTTIKSKKYKLGADDEGKYLRVKVRLSKKDYEPSDWAISPPTLEIGKSDAVKLSTPQGVNISGTEEVYSTLTATVTGSNPNSADVIYQWEQTSDIANPKWIAIGSATKNTYTLKVGDGNKYIRVRAKFAKNGFTSSDWKESSSTKQISFVKLDTLKSVAISGTNSVDSELTATVAGKTAGASVVYQWQQTATTVGTPVWTNIGVGDKYTLKRSDDGKYIRVRARQQRVNYEPSDWKNSSATSKILPSKLITPAGISISGVKEVFSTLTATTTNKPIGATAIYQWQKATTAGAGATWTDIATGAKYRLEPNDNGHYIRVSVLYEQTGYAKSDLEYAIAVGPISLTKLKTPIGVGISGDAKVHSTLTATFRNKPSGATAKFVWETVISAAADAESTASGATYKVRPNDKGKYIRVKVMYEQANYAPSDWKTSSATAKVGKSKLAKAQSLSISGAIKVDSTLTAQHTGMPTGATAIYQWQRSDTDTIGAGTTWADIATGATYTLKSFDFGKYIRVSVKYTQTDYIDSDWVKSRTEEPVQLATPTGVSITRTLSTLTATTTNKPSYATVEYQWQRSDAIGSGVNWKGISSGKSYKLKAEDKGKYIRVGARYTKSGHTSSDWEYSSHTTQISLSKLVTPKSVTIKGEKGKVIEAVGTKLTVTTTNKPKDATVKYNWQRATTDSLSTVWTSIASGASYTIQKDDLNKYIRVSVRYEGTDNEPSDWENSKSIGTVRLPKVKTATSVSIVGKEMVKSTLNVILTATPTGSTTRYQWQRASAKASSSWADIATSSTYTLVKADENQYIRVRVRFEKTDYAPSNWQDSDSTGLIAPYQAPKLSDPTGVTISGTEKVYSVLNAVVTGKPSDASATITYVWERYSTTVKPNWINITGETSSKYTLKPVDKNQYIRVGARFEQKGKQASNWKYSTATTKISLSQVTSPSSVTITGDAKVLSTLTAVHSVKPQGATTAIYNWQRADRTSGAPNWTTISTKSSYKLLRADENKYIRVRVRYEKLHYTPSAWADSNPTVKVSLSQLTPLSTVSISGNVKVNSTLTATTTGALANATVVYDWQRAASTGSSNLNWVSIASGSSYKYKLLRADENNYIRVRVRQEKTDYSPSAWTNSTKTVNVSLNKLPIPQNVVIKGNAKVTSSLTVTVGNKPRNATIKYNWQKAATTGATWTSIGSSSQYSVQYADLGSYIRVSVRYERTDNEPSAWANSDASAMISLIKIAQPSSSSIEGAAEIGNTLKAKHSGVSALGLSVRYDWQRSTTAVANGNWNSVSSGVGLSFSTYNLTGADGGKYIRVRIRYEEIYKESSDWKVSSPTVMVYIAKHPVPAEASVSANIVEWGTDVTFTKVSGQIYRILPKDGSSSLPSYISYDSTNGVISASESGSVILQTRVASTSIKYASDWTAGRIIKFTRKTSNATFNPVAKAKARSADSNKYMFYYKHGLPNTLGYSNPHKQNVTVEPTKDGGSILERNDKPWDSLSSGDYDIVYRFNHFRKLMYIRKGFTGTIKVTFVANKWYKEKSVFRVVSADKDIQSAPSTAPSVDKDSEEVGRKIKVVKTPGLEYRIIGEDGSSPVPSHITYNKASGEIKAINSGGRVLVQARKVETDIKAPSPWSVGKLVTFTVPVGRHIIPDEASVSATRALWGNDITFTKVPGQEYKLTMHGYERPIHRESLALASDTALVAYYRNDPDIYMATGATPTIGKIVANSSGIVMLHTRVATGSGKNASNWSPGTKIIFKRKPSVATFAPVPVAPLPSPDKKVNGTVSANYKHYDHNSTGYSNPHKQKSTFEVDDLNLVFDEIRSKPSRSPLLYKCDLSKISCHKGSGYPGSDIVSGYEETTRLPIDYRLYVKRGVNTSAKKVFYTNAKYEGKTFVATISAPKNVGVLIAPLAPILCLRSSVNCSSYFVSDNITWKVPVIIATSPGEEYRIVDTDDISPAPKKFSYDPIKGIITATAHGSVKVQTRKLGYGSVHSGLMATSPWSPGRLIVFNRANRFEKSDVMSTTVSPKGGVVDLKNLIKGGIDDSVKISYRVKSDPDSIGTLSDNLVTIKSGLKFGLKAEYELNIPRSEAYKAFKAVVTIYVRDNLSIHNFPTSIYSSAVKTPVKIRQNPRGGEYGKVSVWLLKTLYDKNMRVDLKYSGGWIDYDTKSPEAVVKVTSSSKGKCDGNVKDSLKADYVCIGRFKGPKLMAAHKRIQHRIIDVLGKPITGYTYSKSYRYYQFTIDPVTISEADNNSPTTLKFSDYYLGKRVVVWVLKKYEGLNLKVKFKHDFPDRTSKTFKVDKSGLCHSYYLHKDLRDDYVCQGAYYMPKGRTLLLPMSKNKISVDVFDEYGRNVKYVEGYGIDK